MIVASNDQWANSCYVNRAGATIRMLCILAGVGILLVINLILGSTSLEVKLGKYCTFNLF